MDEAQYWLWGQHFAFGYYSKPPLIAWVIGGVTWAAGSDAPFWVRMPGAALHGATAVILAALAARIWGRGAALWTAAGYLSLLMVSLGSILISTDTVMAPFFAAALLFWRRLVEDRRSHWAALAGLMTGLAFLAKYAAVYFLLGAALAAAWASAAIREVFEETGCQVELGEFAGTTNYLVKGIPKIVLYWHMELVQEPHYRPNEETDQLIWLTIPEAWPLLTYPGERMLLNGPLPPRDRHIAAATTFIRNRDNHILLINSPRRGWELPGGIIEAGEDLHQGATRELHEETGIQANLHTLAFVNSSINPPSKFNFGLMGDYVKVLNLYLLRSNCLH